MRHLDQTIFDYIERIKKEIVKIEGLELVEDFITSFGNYTLMLDAVFIKNDEILAVFEFKIYTDELKEQTFLESEVPSKIPYKYFIVTNGKESYVLNTFSGETNRVTSVNELVKYISTVPNAQKTNDIRFAIAETIEKSVSDFFMKEKISSNKLNKRYLKIRDYFTSQYILESLIFDRDGQYFKLSDDIRNLENFENKFFNLLLDDLRPNSRVYRYTTLDTVFATLNHSSIRMNGIVGMNDISEIGYVDRYMDKSFIPYTNPNEIITINKRFIVCCSTISDNLNQWRLYGDDCKGACLVFRVLNRSKLSGLQLKHISYGSKRNGINFHLELELIKFILEEVKTKTGESLRFKTMEIWKHFFKAYEYKEEKEVRLLLILNSNSHIKGEEQYNFNHALKKEWNLTLSHKILAPYITIPLFDPALPIQLEKVVIGSKSPEKVVNERQIQLFLKERKLSKINVEISAIDNYR